MKLRCKEGDLALVIREDTGCDTNVGKLVRVAGPVEMNDRGQQTWLIEPVKHEDWWSVSVAGEPYQRAVTFASRVEHPDDWLLPIDPETWNIDQDVRDKFLETA